MKVAITNDDGSLINQQRYMPFGQVRYLPGTPAITSTDFGYTGQRELDTEIGLMDYKARFYSPYLNQFTQPDSIVPNPSNPQAWNRYAYALNNPIRYNDPSGHCAGICLLAVLVVGAFMLSGDISQEAIQPNPITVSIEKIRGSSATSADALINMFTSDALPGDTPQDRFEAILSGTNNGPYQHFGVEFDDTGFKTELQDGLKWPGSGNQVGHFLTATDLSYSFSDTPLEESALNLIVGHEMYADGSFCCSTSKLGQAIVGSHYNLESDTNSLFLTGTDDAFNEILNMGPAWGKGEGNSIEDLRLSHKGWIFGQTMRQGGFLSLNDVSDWLLENISQ